MKAYCFRTCISISHSNDGEKENAHIHTVEIAAYVRASEDQEGLRKFDDTEVLIESSLEPFRECYLNEMEGFEENVSIEFLGETLFYKLNEKLSENGMYMERFEISETPLRTYILTRTA